MKILPTLAEVQCAAGPMRNTFRFHNPHRNHKDTEKCIDSLLYAGIRPGERNLGTLYIPRL